MSPLTTHVLDMRLGRPAAGIAVRLERLDGTASKELAHGVTNADGRVADLLEPGSLQQGRYRLTFATGPYFDAQQVEYFYPQIPIEFEVTDVTRHHHVPLLVAPFGYSTYRGS